METPLVSILTPAYNSEKLQKPFGLFKIKPTNWEMIIIDDGSIDKTFSIASEMAKTDQ
jgi:glycosyltransferase involved in cell wall biosynthesis